MIRFGSLESLDTFRKTRNDHGDRKASVVAVLTSTSLGP
jgi:hypothetical protein